ncbi:MAG: hypothetical protein JSU62_06670, partial [Gammaproteobacteria bacterium]
LYLFAAVGIALLLRRSRTAALGLALWLAALLPTQSFVPKLDALSNRPLSLALAGLLIAAAPLVAVAVSRMRARVTGDRSSVWPGRIAAAAAVLVVALLAQSTAHRSALFRSGLALWQDAAAKSTAGARPHLQYAMLLKQAGRDRDAWQAISIARGIDPFSARIDVLYKAWRPEKQTP